MSCDPNQNFGLVEGEWNQFTFRRITTDDYPTVLTHIKDHFLREEPTCQLLGYTDAFGNEMSLIITQLLNENLSFLAEHTATKELAALRVNFKQTKAAVINDKDVVEAQTDVFMNRIDWSEEKKMEVLTKYGVEEYAELFISSTDPKYRNQGLALELYNRSLLFLKAQGFLLVKCISTNEVSRRAASKLDFEEVSRVKYEDVVGRDGKPAFAVATGSLTDQHFAAGMIKLLK